jgi:TonB family protein
MLARHRSYVAAAAIAAAPVVLLAQGGSASAPPGTRWVMAVPGSQAPRYPDSLRTARVSGNVLAAFVVDTAGIADPTTIKIVRATDPLFADAVRNAVPNMRFLPAVVNGRSVRQAVQQPIIFNIAGLPESGEERSAKAEFQSLASGSSDGSGRQMMTLGVIVIRGNPGR